MVFVLDKDHQPLQPCHPARARELLAKGRAVVHRQVPFVIRLKDRTVGESIVDGVQVGIDPGSKTTGVAVFTVAETVDENTGEVVATRDGIWLGELVHRGLAIKNALQARSALRRGRRSRNTRYRAPRFLNRARRPNPTTGVWLPPSLQHRVDTTTAWVDRLSRWAPVTHVHVERVRFDMQLLTNPGIAGVQYQQGTLAGTEVREYLLAKWGRVCAYCDTTGVGPAGVPLNIDHVHPRARGGTDAISNLTLVCIPCNQNKGVRPVQEFLAHDPARLARITRQLRTPLRDAAAVNTTRWALTTALTRTGTCRGFTVHASTGGRTKYNRTVSAVPKTHALDALCVGTVEKVTHWPATTHVAACTGRGSYARTRSDRFGFPRLVLTRTKRHHGFSTGDLVTATVPAGAKVGTHTGRVAVRATGSFNIATATGTVQGIHYRHVRLIQRGDGYRHTTNPTPPRKETAA